MKSLGVVQFQQKRFKLLGVNEEWKGIMGQLPTSFIGTIYGDSGNGKTEFCIRLAKYLTNFDKASWLSYEQGHGFDLQLAINRNKLEEVNKKITFIDPLKKLPKIEGKEKADILFEELMKYLKRRGSPRFVFIDSIDYTDWEFDHYAELKEQFGEKKGIIFISHAKGKYPKTQLAKDIMYDGQFGIFVRTFIATPVKSRLGGIEDYIIWEERARQMNPTYFAKKENGL
jgi:hypothetical protein